MIQIPVDFLSNTISEMTIQRSKKAFEKIDFGCFLYCKRTNFLLIVYNILLKSTNRGEVGRFLSEKCHIIIMRSVFIIGKEWVINYVYSRIFYSN